MDLVIPSQPRRLAPSLLVLPVLWALVSCGGGGGEPAPATAAPTPQPMMAVRVAIDGLAMPGLLLQLGDERASVPPGTTTFAFAQPLPQGSRYEVKLVRQPEGAGCYAVHPGSGIAGPAEPALHLRCGSGRFAASLHVAGLDAPGLRLRIGDETVDVDPAVASRDPVATAAAYLPGSTLTATIVQQPQGQVCRNRADLNDPAPSFTGMVREFPLELGLLGCAKGFHAIGGRIEGATSTSLALEMPVDYPQPVAGFYLPEQQVEVPAGSASWQFPQVRADGTPYQVRLARQPVHEDCSLPQPAGVTGEASPVAVPIRCSPAPPGFRVEGTVTVSPADGGHGDHVELALGGQVLQVDTRQSRRFQFPVRLAPGTAYDIRVTRQPIGWHGPYVRSGLACSVVANGSGTIGATAPAMVEVLCR